MKFFECHSERSEESFRARKTVMLLNALKDSSSSSAARTALNALLGMTG
jgi:hypothetical protein